MTISQIFIYFFIFQAKPTIWTCSQKRASGTAPRSRRNGHQVVGLKPSKRATFSSNIAILDDPRPGGMITLLEPRRKHSTFWPDIEIPSKAGTFPLLNLPRNIPTVHLPNEAEIWVPLDEERCRSPSKMQLSHSKLERCRTLWRRTAEFISFWEQSNNLHIVFKHLFPFLLSAWKNTYFTRIFETY